MVVEHCQKVSEIAEVFGSKALILMFRVVYYYTIFYLCGKIILAQFYNINSYRNPSDIFLDEDAPILALSKINCCHPEKCLKFCSFVS